MNKVKEINLDDGALIRRFQDGDHTAFDQLIRKHEKRAYSYAHRLTSNPEEAADVVAEGFIRVYKSLKGFRGTSAFSTWLYRIMTNCYFDLCKKHRNRETVNLELVVQTAEGEFEAEFEDPSLTPFEEAARQERFRTIEEAIKQMPPLYRAMIVQFHAECLSYEEIAQNLGIPVGTVKSRLNRARIALRNVLPSETELYGLDAICA